MESAPTLIFPISPSGCGPVSYTHLIQLLSTDGSNQRDVELFLESISGTLDSRQIRVYRSSLSGRDRLGVIYGDYPSREAATAELAKLARSSLGSNPYVRSINKIR